VVSWCQAEWRLIEHVAAMIRSPNEEGAFQSERFAVTPNKSLQRSCAEMAACRR
jgi:hypothetical protein